jgi:hypothetical protein
MLPALVIDERPSKKDLIEADDERTEADEDRIELLLPMLCWLLVDNGDDIA